MRPGVFNPFADRKESSSSEKKDTKYNPSSVDVALSLHRQARDGRTRDQAELGIITRSADSFFSNAAPLSASSSLSLNMGADAASKTQSGLTEQSANSSVDGSGNRLGNGAEASNSASLNDSLQLSNNKEALFNGTTGIRPSFESVLANPVTPSSSFTTLGAMEDESDLKYMPKGSLLNVMA